MSDALQAPERLTDKLAGLLLQRIESGELAPDERLPTEQRLAEQFGVSRTVVREAVSRLKSIGLLTSRQGSGVFVAPRHQARALAFDPMVVTSMESVLQVVEVRRGLEADVAALAAQRMTPEKARVIADALEQLEACPPQGAQGVEADLAFHRSIARATENPQYERLLGFLEQYQREAMSVTRTNEALDSGYMVQVREEHRAIAEAVMRGDATAARQAAMLHMNNAAVRLHNAAPSIRRALGALLAQSPSGSSS
ncbi:FadR/GntR family transcriptional regulator [Hydrogenophaga sp. PBL-H3]|uniref:FadR/GntR family transcriptional regulator n=1 Tax=Hydrogenophaga sp. PBL-H3 TaxID=434010 RepID=UPI00131FD4EF|nr:FadR/GntR family transcriptional regulator [Hydrogenophaga sp. PBL-H3]QHE74594.1 FadR family transcriptional regulator [Hydrogenophaga sp. PBL-H3]QHE79019.1 FadR family transcriptional regulator [Hydrogenophaga sp. PBL-H3]